MRHLLLLTGLTAANLLQAQNVGVGTTIPTEKLDVNGNINVTGTIKANGVDGQPNQVLAKSSSGALVWADVSGYKNFTSLTAATGNWVVPAGVTRIMVEMWGAGGGGNQEGGGGSGAYIRAQLNVTPGSSYTYTVGVGGGGVSSTSDAIDGGNTQFALGGLSLNAGGGQGAEWISSTVTQVGGIGTFTVTGTTNYVAENGLPGNPLRRRFFQYDATTFYEEGDAGPGADAPHVKTGGNGYNYIYNITGGAIVNRIQRAGSGRVPGGGGSSGVSFPGTINGGYNGGNGLIIVYY